MASFSFCFVFCFVFSLFRSRWKKRGVVGWGWGLWGGGWRRPVDGVVQEKKEGAGLAVGGGAYVHGRCTHGTRETNKKKQPNKPTNKQTDQIKKK